MRALDFYLKPTPAKETSDKPNTIFRIAPDVDSECLLANLSETLRSAVDVKHNLAAVGIHFSSIECIEFATASKTGIRP